MAQSMTASMELHDPATIVNTEWGGFASPLLPRCAADAALDVASVRPGEQLFEKMVGGYYMGEVARLCVLVYCFWRFAA